MQDLFLKVSEESENDDDNSHPYKRIKWAPTNPIDWTNIHRKQLSLSITRLFPSNGDVSRKIFQLLEDQVVYFDPERTKVNVFGKFRYIRRQQAMYGDPGLSYAYSNISVPTEPWVLVLKDLRDRIEEVSGIDYNTVIVNRYKDGNDNIGYHRDSEIALDPSAPIASLSFGAKRDFCFKHTDRYHMMGDDITEPIVNVALEDGMLLLMKPPTNKYWYHTLPIRKNCKNVRINLTFRKIDRLPIS